MTIARVQDGQVLEYRNTDMAAIPEHKRYLWKPVQMEGAGPTEQLVIEADRVRRVRSWSHEQMVARVVAERTRRLAFGFNYDFQDARGVHHIGTTPEDMTGWRDVIDYANALVDLGDVTTTIAIVTDTGPAQVTAPEWQAVMLQAAAVRQTLWAKSFALQAMNPIPSDFADDSHWT
jgi:hypothetical protein